MAVWRWPGAGGAGQACLPELTLADGARAVVIPLLEQVDHSDPVGRQEEAQLCRGRGQRGSIEAWHFRGQTRCVRSVNVLLFVHILTYLQARTRSLRCGLIAVSPRDSPYLRVNIRIPAHARVKRFAIVQHVLLDIFYEVFVGG